MPRSKSELTKSGRAIGVRLTEWQYQEWTKLGASKWLRQMLAESRKKEMQNINKVRQSFEDWVAARGRVEQLKWLGNKYEHPRIQSQWLAFVMGWTMCNNSKG